MPSFAAAADYATPPALFSLLLLMLIISRLPRFISLIIGFLRFFAFATIFRCHA